MTPSGALGAKPSRLPLSIGDGELADTADAVVSVPEMFNYWLQGGRCCATPPATSWTGSTTGWPLKTADRVGTTEPPADRELAALRALKAA
jgi:hypothetical protein